ncbi:MAG: DUF262 domain-containing protein [Egibacteraceae bacterium]
MTTVDSIVEEYDGNVATGVEAEELEDGEQIQPWDPETIRVNTRQFSLRNILDQIEDHDIELAPDFQRHRVWNHRQKSRLIESILLQIPLPAFYFAEDAEGMYRVVDGLQRLSTVNEFVRRNQFALKDLEYLKDAEGKRHDELAAAWRRRISNAQIVVHVVDPTTPDGVKYDIFKRINTGGTPLNAQEIRHCMSKDRSRNFLKDCAASEEFRQATPKSLHDHARMVDREAVLRFCAFRRIGGWRGYSEYGSMETLLQRTTAALDDPAIVSGQELDGLASDFLHAMRNSYLVFGRHAFRKWPRDTDSLNPFNRALFESWSVALADRDADWLTAVKEATVSSARQAMTDDADYIAAISYSTGSYDKVQIRFEKALEILAEVRG